MSTKIKTRFRYSGPMSGMTLMDGTEVMLIPGKAVELPADNPHVVALVARRHLTEEPTTSAAPVRKSTKQEDK